MRASRTAKVFAHHAHWWINRASLIAGPINPKRVRSRIARKLLEKYGTGRQQKEGLV
jgi:hypothetical protein